MGRGYIYHFTTDPYTCGDIGEGSFYEEHGAWEDVEDAPIGDCAALLEALKARLHNAGFRINNQPKTVSGDVAEHVAFSIAPMDKEALAAAKRAFFKPFYVEFQTKVANLTLDDFTHENIISSLQMLLDDDYGDAVCLDGGYGWRLETFDYAMRELKPNTEYFVADNVVYMH